MIALYAAAFAAAAAANVTLVVFAADWLSPKSTNATPTRRPAPARASLAAAQPLAA